MKISIITVVYNNKKTIQDTIKSVLSQDYKNIEYIIIDGGSTDGTLDIINKYKKRIRKIISEKDHGIYDAMNKGIKLATGSIIGILNSDDIYFDNTIISNVINISKKKPIDCLYGDLIYISKTKPNKIIRNWESSRFIKNSFLKGFHPPHPTFFVKKELFTKYGLYDTNFKISADFELMLRFLEKYNITSYYLPKTIIKMRTGGISNNNIFNIIMGNIYCLKAFKKNGYNIPVNYILLRMISKIKQIIN